MKLVDLNVLIYAVDEASAHHRVASEFLTDALTCDDTVGIPTAVAIGFIRLTTSPKVMERPIDARTSISVVDGWMSRSNVVQPQPTGRHLQVLADLLAPLGTAGNLVSDAHLAALAVEHAAELWSFDHDFGRFGGVDWHSPTG